METLPVLLSKRAAPMPGPTLTLEPTSACGLVPDLVPLPDPYPDPVADREPVAGPDASSELVSGSVQDTVAAASGWDCLAGTAAAGSGVSEGRLARMRQRVDLLIAQMLADDTDDQPDVVGELRSDPEPDSELDPDAEPGLDGGRAFSPEPDPDSEPYPMPRPAADPDREPRGTGPDRTCGCGELLPLPAAASAGRPAGGYQSKHGLTGASKEPRPADIDQRRPRHAAPSVSLRARVRNTAGLWLAATGRAAASGAALGRRLGPVRLTSRSAAHAGW